MRRLDEIKASVKAANRCKPGDVYDHISEDDIVWLVENAGLMRVTLETIALGLRCPEVAARVALEEK